MSDETPQEEYSIKAAGDFELDVLGVPFGGPNKGRDSDGEYFTAKTDLMADEFPSVPVFYYHGYTPDGKPQGEPEVIGRATYSQTNERGHWFKVVLNKASEYARRVWEAAKDNMARASSGSLTHLVRKADDGEILVWPLAELSVFDIGQGRQPANGYAVAMPAAKAHYQSAGLDMPTKFDDKELEMDEKEKKYKVEGELTLEAIAEVVQEAVADAVEEVVDEPMTMNAKAQAAALVKKAQDAAVAQAKRQWEAEAAKANRLPNFGKAPVQAKYGETWKFDNYSAADLSFAAEVLKSKDRPASPALLKALALKMQGGNFDEKQALKSANIKADETDYTSNSGFGSDWVGTSYSNDLWEQVRGMAEVAGQIPVGPDIPQGFSSVYIPLESTDPVFYKVAEATDSTYNSTTGIHNATVPSGGPGTANKQITVGKMGSRVIFSGEMEEDSLVAFAANARRQMAAAAAEVMDYVVINGDTDATASTNINAIDTEPVASRVFLLTNGLRKLPLITNTANSRSAGGSLDVTDFLETLKLMGTAGLAGADPTKTAFIVDLNTYYKLMALPELQSRDVFSAATIENGVLTRIYGRPLIASAFMHGMNGYPSAKRLANAAGKVDADTEGNNLYGAILGVRWDQWQIRYKRRWTLESVRRPESDTNEIVGLTRWGLGYRDNEASAITYYVGV